TPAAYTLALHDALPISHFGGAFEPGSMENTYHTFHAGGLDWLIVSLEFGTRNGVLQWAGEVIEAHPDHKVIINTHDYMYSDDTRSEEHTSELQSRENLV